MSFLPGIVRYSSRKAQLASYLLSDHSREYATFNIVLSVLSTRSSASNELNSRHHPFSTFSTATMLSPKIISGTGMPSLSDIASIASDLEIGSLRVLIVHPCWVKDTVADLGLPGDGNDSVMGPFNDILTDIEKVRDALELIPLEGESCTPQSRKRR